MIFPINFPESSVVKDYLTTASDGKNYNVTYYALPMVLAVGFRVRSIRENRKNREILEYFFSAYPQHLNNNSVWGFFNFPKHSLPQFFVINAYTTGISSTVLENILKTTPLPLYPNGKVALDREYNDDKPKTAVDNAVYIINAKDFEELSRKEKPELIKDSRVQRKYHNDTFEKRMSLIINAEGTEKEQEEARQLVYRLRTRR